MKKTMMVMVLVGSFLMMVASMSVAATDHEAHHPVGKQPATTNSSSGMHGSGMHGSGMHGSGMMACQSPQSFFLDQATELGLSEDQIAKLKAIRSDTRKEIIRTSAEVKIARLELAELLDGEDWSLKSAEELIRKSQKLEGDIQVRQLKALKDARKVLSKEQLEQANSGGSSEKLEDLFQ